MCFTVSLKSDQKKTEKRFNAKFAEPENIKPIFYTNAFTHPNHPVILNKDPGLIQMASWGLIPPWAKDEEIQNKTCNARAETIHEKPSFKHAAKSGYCLVLVDGFFEWQEVKGKKYPYYIYKKDQEPFALAGLWEPWTNPETGEIKKTFTIITCEANELLAKIHNKKKRMPVILGSQNEQKWLEGDAPLEPYKGEDLDAHTVSKLVTARGVERNVPEVIKQFTYKEL
ncbi:SOS response-associated peptidase [Patescibacteria group bacterium]